MNIERFSFGEGKIHTPSYTTPQPDVRNYGWTAYGLRVGIWRFFDLMDELKLPACHLVNSSIYDHGLEIIKKIRKRKDEIIGHGRTNTESQGELSLEKERELIIEATQAIKKNEGKQPKGWMGPWISESHHTPDLLQENGYKYLMDWPMDDQPIWMKTKKDKILSIPYPVEINDAPAMLYRHHTPEQFARMFMDQLDVLLEESEKYPVVCGLSLHTFIVGQPFRFKYLKKMLEYVKNHKKKKNIWFTRPGEIADYVYKKKINKTS